MIKKRNMIFSKQKLRLIKKLLKIGLCSTLITSIFSCGKASNQIEPAQIRSSVSFNDSKPSLSFKSKEGQKNKLVNLIVYLKEKSSFNLKVFGEEATKFKVTITNKATNEVVEDIFSANTTVLGSNLIVGDTYKITSSGLLENGDIIATANIENILIEQNMNPNIDLIFTAITTPIIADGIGIKIDLTKKITDQRPSVRPSTTLSVISTPIATSTALPTPIPTPIPTPTPVQKIGEIELLHNYLTTPRTPILVANNDTGKLQLDLTLGELNKLYDISTATQIPIIVDSNPKIMTGINTFSNTFSSKTSTPFYENFSFGNYPSLFMEKNGSSRNLANFVVEAKPVEVNNNINVVYLRNTNRNIEMVKVIEDSAGNINTEFKSLDQNNSYVNQFGVKELYASFLTAFSTSSNLGVPGTFLSEFDMNGTLVKTEKISDRNFSGKIAIENTVDGPIVVAFDTITNNNEIFYRNKNNEFIKLLRDNLDDIYNLNTATSGNTVLVTFETSSALYGYLLDTSGNVINKKILKNRPSNSGMLNSSIAFVSGKYWVVYESNNYAISLKQFDPATLEEL